MNQKIQLALVILLMAHLSLAQKGEPASVVIIMADQLRFDVVGDLTPNIKSLGEDGIIFNRTYCASPICVPSRGSFFTGLYPNRTGSLINAWQEEDETFGLVKAGIPNLYTLMEGKWDSHHVGKQHFFTEEKIDENAAGKTKWITQKDYTQWVKQRKVTKPGGPEFKAIVPEMVSGRQTHTRSYSIPVVALYKDGVDNFLDHYIGNESVAAIKKRDRQKPLLLNAMFLAPHPPFHIPDPYFSMINEKDVSLPQNVGQWYSGQSPLQLYNLTGFLGTRYSRDEWRSVWTKYLGLVKLLDDEVGRIIQTLKDEGLYEKSIIVFTADHGEMLGSHSLWQKMCMYEESARVPLAIKFPDGFKTELKETDAAVSLVDVFPTLLDYNRLALPKDLDGRSLLPMIQGKGKNRTSVFVQYDGNGSLGNYQRCVVKDDYKLIVDIFKDEIYLELYNVREDPQETVNLAFQDQHKQTTLALLSEVKEYMQQTGDRLKLPENLYDDFLNHYRKLMKE